MLSVKINFAHTHTHTHTKLLTDMNSLMMGLPGSTSDLCKGGGRTFLSNLVLLFVFCSCSCCSTLLSFPRLPQENN